MTPRPFPAALAVLAWMAFAPPLLAQPPIAEYAASFQRRDGFFPLYWDASKGRLLLEVPRPGQEFLYLTSLATGVGDVEVGIDLDRGTPGEEAVARFERVGPRVHLILRNTRFRATSGDEHLARSVEESFATSTVGSFEVLAQEEGRVLLDATSLFLSDVIDVRRLLRDANQGAYLLDRERSRIHLPRTRAFPENTEVEAALTFTTDQPGPRLREHAPDARAITLRQHHSLVKLPDSGYRPRAFDPRIGVSPTAFYDFAKPFDQDPVTRYIRRHRLIKRDSFASLGEPVKPIVYYLDPAVPEPYRAAFKEGAAWWNELFEEAGFKDAFLVEDMPGDMDPLDARYNVIQWFHRSQASSSVGPSFVDPRTGEIIKAAVRMDSHRSLANYDLYAAMLPALGRDAGRPDPEAEAFVMARRRQHAAHEVGHTLGFAHNFAAAFDDRASVMAYPAPRVRLVDGRLDLSDAYRAGPGPYDALAIRYAYTEFPPGQEEAGLRAILEEIAARGLRFLTNPHEGSDSSFPEGSVWVNGQEAVEELVRVMEVRRVLVDRFDERAIRPGEPMVLLGRRFTAAYLYHAQTLAAAVKAIGGMEFRYGVRGDPGPHTEILDPGRQRRALELALDCLEPKEVAVPERVLALLGPVPFGYQRDEYVLPSKAGEAFDQLGLARALARSVVGQILSPPRAARLAAFAARRTGQPPLEEVIGRLIERTWERPAPAEGAALKWVVQRVVVDELMALAAHKDATPEARAGTEWGLRRVASLIKGAVATPSRAEAAHRALARSDIERFLERREVPPPRSEPPSLPRRIPLSEG